MSRARRRLVLFLVYGISLLAVAALAWRGGSYYLTPLAERPRHPDFWSWKPGGSVGHALGIVGSALMVLMMLYTVRKRLPALRKAGGLHLWLDFHIYCGVVGPLLVVLHSSFKVQGLVALSFWSMIVVALSGFVGRYLYAQIPRRRSGDAMSAQEVETRQAELVRHLRDDHHLPEAELGTLAAIVDRGTGGRSLLVLLLTLPLTETAWRWRLARFRRRYRALPSALYADLSATLTQHTLLRHRLAIWDKAHRLFEYWHVVHKPFAIVMYLFMVVHVAVAMMTGYGWHFGR